MDDQKLVQLPPAEAPAPEPVRSGRSGQIPLSVLVVDDDEIVRTWVRHAVGGTEFRVAAEASRAAEALAFVGRRHLDVLVVDQHLPDQVGTELMKEIRRAGCRVPAVLMTATAKRGLNEAAREAGFQSSVVKSSEPARLLDVLRAVLAGSVVFDAAHPRRPDSEAPLSQRERDVIALVAQGMTNREVGEALHLSGETVKTYLERAYEKLGARRRAEAVLEARRRGLL